MHTLAASRRVCARRRTKVRCRYRTCASARRSLPRSSNKRRLILTYRPRARAHVTWLTACKSARQMCAHQHTKHRQLNDKLTFVTSCYAVQRRQRLVSSLFLNSVCLCVTNLAVCLAKFYSCGFVSVFAPCYCCCCRYDSNDEMCTLQVLIKECDVTWKCARVAK